MFKTSFARSVATSIFSTAVDFGTLMGLFELAHVQYVVATVIGTTLGFLANFTVNRYWAFDARDGNLRWQFVRVLPVQGGSTGLQALGVWLCVGVAGLHVWTAKIVVATLVYLCWNYPMNRFWVFRTKVGAKPESMVRAPAAADR